MLEIIYTSVALAILILGVVYLVLIINNVTSIKVRIVFVFSLFITKAPRIIFYFFATQIIYLVLLFFYILLKSFLFFPRKFNSYNSKILLSIGNSFFHPTFSITSYALIIVLTFLSSKYFKYHKYTINKKIAKFFISKITIL